MLRPVPRCRWIRVACAASPRGPRVTRYCPSSASTNRSRIRPKTLSEGLQRALVFGSAVGVRDSCSASSIVASGWSKREAVDELVGVTSAAGFLRSV